MPDFKDKLVVRVAAALAVVLWFGVTGALVGLGAYYLFPAQYRSTGTVVVGEGEVSERLARASVLADAARSTATLSKAILVGDLYHGDRDSVALPDLAGKLPFTADVRPVVRGAIVDVSMTYTDRERVQRALDSVIRQMVSEDAPRSVRVGSFAMNTSNASAGVRVRGLEPGAALLGGFILGLLFHSVYAQMRMPKRTDRRLWLQ